MVNITAVNLLKLASSIPYAQEIASLAIDAPDAIQFISYNSTFETDILGTNASSTLVAETSWDAFHEAGVYNKETNSLHISSNWAENVTNSMNITILSLDDWSISTKRYPNLSSPNGGSAYYPPGTPRNSSTGQQMIFCDQGDLENPSQLTVVDPATNQTRVLLNNFLGKDFSSINDVVQHPDSGELWFTDARYGYWRYFRPTPIVPPSVYRFDPTTGVVQAIADGFVAPNGIEFSPDFKHVYVTDTGTYQFVNETHVLTNPATIYRYDISANGKGLENRRVFAYVDTGIPDGIHTDTEGNVYSACGDGVNVWNKEGVLLGKFAVKDGGANFAWIPGGMVLYNNFRAFKVTFKAEGRTVRRDFGLN